MKNKFEVRGEVTAIFLHRRITKSIIETFIDTADLPIAQSMPLTWYAWWSPLSKTFYVRNRLGEMLHTRITSCPKDLEVDHKNHDGLDNRKENLFKSTKQFNRLNQGKAQPGTASGLRGVTFHQGKWRARLVIDGKEVRLGRWTHKEDASEVVENYLLIKLGRQRYRHDVTLPLAGE